MKEHYLSLATALLLFCENKWTGARSRHNILSVLNRLRGVIIPSNQQLSTQSPPGKAEKQQNRNNWHMNYNNARKSIQYCRTYLHKLLLFLTVSVFWPHTVCVSCVLGFNWINKRKLMKRNLYPIVLMKGVFEVNVLSYTLYMTVYMYMWAVMCPRKYCTRSLEETL